MENENKAIEYVLDSFAFLAHLEKRVKRGQTPKETMAVPSEIFFTR